MNMSKYTASGNSFLIFHSPSFECRDDVWEGMSSRLCDQAYGVGADGLVVLLPNKEYSYEWRFYNSDGSAALMCGNASRCAGLYALHNMIAGENHTFLSGAGAIEVTIREILDNKSAVVESNIGFAVFNKDVLDGGYSFKSVLIPIPHLVYEAKTEEEYLMLISRLDLLSDISLRHNSNVSIFLRMDDGVISYFTFERGVNKVTSACGTGACAVYSVIPGLGERKTLIPPSKDRLTVSYNDRHGFCFSGKACKVCDLNI